jgi:K+-transporting ATPase c subunit
MAQTDDSRAAERARIKAIRGHEAAASHPELADHLALETDLTAEQAAGILAAAAKDKPAAPAPQANTFMDAMRGSGSGVDPNTPEKPAELSVAQQALAAFTLATGRAVK